MFPLPQIVIAIGEIALPAVVALVAGAIFGHRNVRVLREKTGDDSILTNVLSGEAFVNHRRNSEDKKAA